jgi:hypothetical protein
MARKRLISPEFFKHGSLFDAEQSTGLPLRLAFAGLWCQADKEGRFKWRPRELKLDILPYDQTDFGAVLSALQTFGFVKAYVVDGEAFGVIPSFGKWQTFHHTERPSVLPSPLTNGEVPVTLPAVTGTVTGTVTDNNVPPHGGGVAQQPAETAPNPKPTPAKRSSPKADVARQTWLTPAAKAWDDRMGAGSFPFGQAARELAPLHRAGLTPEQIGGRLSAYLMHVDPQFASVRRFAQVHGQYANGAPPSPQDAEYARLAAEAADIGGYVA